MPLSLTHALAEGAPPADGALGESPPVDVQHKGKLIGAGTEPRAAIGALINAAHDQDVAQNRQKKDRECHPIPRDLARLSKPVDPAGGEGKHAGRGKERERECLYNSVTDAMPPHENHSPFFMFHVSFFMAFIVGYGTSITYAGRKCKKKLKFATSRNKREPQSSASALRGPPPAAW